LSATDEKDLIFIEFISSAYFHREADKNSYFRQQLAYFRRFLADENILFSCSEDGSLSHAILSFPSRPEARDEWCRKHRLAAHVHVRVQRAAGMLAIRSAGFGGSGVGIGWRNRHWGQDVCTGLLALISTACSVAVVVSTVHHLLDSKDGPTGNW
jgi:hypothetical protein